MMMVVIFPSLPSPSRVSVVAPVPQKFTRANCTGLGVPDYFKVIVNPMDLTRMGVRDLRRVHK